MRRELYDKIASALAKVGDGAVKHIDLWNRNVEFIEQETAWERPAVFIEFEPVQWKSIVPGVEYRAEARVRLHIVTDWANCNGGLTGCGDLFDLPELIHEQLAGLEGNTLSTSHFSD